MIADRLFRTRRAVTRGFHRAIDFPDDHGWLCVLAVVAAGFAGAVWGVLAR